MNPLTRVLALATLTAWAFCGCKTGQTPDGGTPTGVVGGVVDCGEAAVHAGALNILGDAASALATGNWEGAIADLVGRAGIAAVACAVKEIAGSSLHNAQATHDALEASKAERGRLWLERQSFIVRP